MNGHATAIAGLALTTWSMDAVAQAQAQTAEPAPLVRIPREQVRKQAHDVHPDYRSLSGGLVLWGAAYGLALAEPLRHGFEGTSGKRAYPLAGPWFPSISWAWALDGVLQLAGVAFIGNAFVNPVVVVGTPSARRLDEGSPDTLFGVQGAF